MKILKSDSHSGYPVLSEEKFVGFILREQLLVLLESESFSRPRSRSDFLRRIQVPSPDGPGRLEDIELGTVGDDMEIDLEPAMNIGPHLVSPECPLSRAYTMFCFLGLRHLVVVDTDHHVVGIITRKDLLNVEEIVNSKKASFEKKLELVSQHKRPRV